MEQRWAMDDNADGASVDATPSACVEQGENTNMDLTSVKDHALVSGIFSHLQEADEVDRQLSQTLRQHKKLVQECCNLATLQAQQEQIVNNNNKEMRAQTPSLA